MSAKNKKNDAKEKVEVDCNTCFTENNTCPPIKHVTHPLRYYEFTQDELKALEECDRESFYKRCVPFSSAFATATYAAIKTGHLRANPRFGAFPKITLAVVMGYFLGKLSYQQACADKLMALPGSYIGQLLRDRRDGKIGGPNPPKQATTMFGANPSDIYSDAGPGSSLDLDTDRPIFSDDSYRPDNDGAAPPAAAAPARAPLSYDDLRRQNRGQHSDAKQDPYKMDQSMLPQISRPRPAPAHTNQYGDAVE